MSSHTEAVESIRVLAARLEGITKVANSLERIGSLEDAERDAKDRLESTKQTEAEVQVKVKAALTELESIRETAVLEAAAAAVEAQTTRDAAAASAEKLIVDAHAEADRLLNAARDQAAQMVSLARTNAAVADVDAIEKAKLAAASQALVDAATKELDELNQRLTTVRSQAARILAGE